MNFFVGLNGIFTGEDNYDVVVNGRSAEFAVKKISPVRVADASKRLFINQTSHA